MLNSFEKNIRHYPKKGIVNPRSLIALPSHTPHERVEPRRKDPVNDGWESVDGEDEGPVQAMDHERPARSWPDGGINRPSSNVIYPKEDDAPRISGRSIHSIPVQDGYTSDLDDCNDWGGLIDRDIIGRVTTETPVIVSGEDPQQEKTAGFYYNFFREDSQAFKWIVPGFLAGGAHPLYYSFKDNLNHLKDAGFKAVVSTFELPLDIKHTSGLEYFFIPTPDNNSAHLFEICEFISKMEEDGKPVFVHCLDGNDRTGTVLAAYLAYRNWLTIDEAIAYVRQSYSPSVIQSIQEDELHRLAIRL